MALDLLLTAVRRDVMLRVMFDGPLAFDDRRALDLRDIDYGSSHYLEGTMRVVAEAKETLLTLGRICQGKNGVNELGLKLGI